ncbi:MAG: glycerophosphodiester phosphodiesterase family protein [Myxococcota bacterium]
MRSLIRGGDAPGWLLRRPVAHRGLHDELRPENSLAAFDAAAAAGYPIELDVHRTRDDGVVVFHDETLERMTGRPGAVRDCTLDDLTCLQLASCDERVPSLDQVLECVADRVPVVVELKAESPIGRLEQGVLDVLRRWPGRYVVQSFNPRSLHWLRQHAPDLPRGMLAGRTRDWEMKPHEKPIVQHLLAAPWVRPHYVGYELASLREPAPRLLRRLGIPLLAWTIKDESGLTRGRALADNVIFEGVRP